MKNPLILPEIDINPQNLPSGTKGLFVKSDGVYILNDDGTVKKMGYEDHSIYKFRGNYTSGLNLPKNAEVGAVYNIIEKSYITMEAYCAYFTGQFSDYFNFVYESEGVKHYEFNNATVWDNYRDYFVDTSSTGSYGETCVYNIDGSCVGVLPYAQATGYAFENTLNGYNGNDTDIVSFFISATHISAGLTVIPVKAGENVAWTGITWDSFGGLVDLSLYPTKQELNEALKDYYSKTELDEKLEYELNLKADAKTSGGGFVAGDITSVQDSAVGIGKQVVAKNGGTAIGYQANANGGAAVGSGTNASDYGAAVGMNAKAGAGFSGGKDAKAATQSGYSTKFIDAIQLGSGTNSTEKSLQVYEYQLMGADGKIPFERLPEIPSYWGGNVSSVSQLPSSPKAGTYCYVTADISNGVKYTGRVGDLFSCDGGDLWSYTLMFTPPSKCVYTEPDVTVNPSYTFIYNESGTRLGSISIDPTEMPGAFDASLLGVSSADDMVTFYLGIHNNGTFPAHIYNFKAGEMIFWNGSMWCAVLPSSAIEEIDSTLNLKADKASTLSGYGITDAYTKYVVDAKDDILKAELSAIKQKSIPHTSVSEYPVSISDHLENEEVINYRIYGNSVQSETPSVDNPVEVQSVGDLVTDSESEYYGKYDVPVIMCGKNLIPYPYSTTTATINGITFTDNGDGSVTVNGTATSTATWFFYQVTTSLIPGLKTGDTVTLSIDCDKTWTTTTATMNVVCNYYNSSAPMQDGKCVVNSSSKYKTIVIGDDWVGMGIYVVVYNGQTISNVTLKPQIEFGSNNTEYEPYICETKHLYLNEPLRKVGDYADYIDFENQKVVRNISNRDMGELNYRYYSSDDAHPYGYFVASGSKDFSGIRLPNSKVMCEIYNSSVGNFKTDKTIFPTSTTSIYIVDSDYTSGDAIKNAVTGQKIYIIRATPIEEPITVPELTALNSEVMNVFSSTATPPSNINFVYYQDINTVIAELKNAILSQGGDV